MDEKCLTPQEEEKKEFNEAIDISLAEEEINEAYDLLDNYKRKADEINKDLYDDIITYYSYFDNKVKRKCYIIIKEALKEQDDGEIDRLIKSEKQAEYSKKTTDEVHKKHSGSVKDKKRIAATEAACQEVTNKIDGIIKKKEFIREVTELMMPEKPHQDTLKQQWKEVDSNHKRRGREPEE
ncbi:MAG: hypothetical protein IKN64_11295 [Desulfovibrio sp.]|nr:hypothetical protein [Desulfovibrio sp.]